MSTNKNSFNNTLQTFPKPESGIPVEAHMHTKEDVRLVSEGVKGRIYNTYFLYILDIQCLQILRFHRFDLFS